jgi:hypothetical protein
VRDACYANVDFVLSKLCLLLAGQDFGVDDAGDTDTSVLAAAEYDHRRLTSRPVNGIWLVTAMLENSVSVSASAEVSGLASSTVSVLTTTPCKEEYCGCLNSTLATIKVFGAFVTSFCSDALCGDLLAPIKEDLPVIHLENLVDLDPKNSVSKFQSLVAGIISVDIHRCEQVVCEHRSFVIQSADYLTRYLLNSNSGMFCTMSVEDIALQLNEFSVMSSKIAQIPSGVHVGTVFLKLETVKNKLSSLMLECTSLAYKIIPEYLAAVTERFNISISVLLRSLQEPPENLDQFVSKVEIYYKAVDLMESYRTDYSLLVGLREVLDQSGIGYKSIVSLTNSTISVWSNYNDAVTDFTDKLETRTKQYKIDLKAKARVLLVPMETAKVFVMSGTVLNPISDPDVVLADLAQHNKEMEVVRQESLIIEKYQDTLKVKVFNIDPVVEIIEELSRYKVQWDIMKLVKETQLELLRSKFMDVLSELILQEIGAASITVGNHIAQYGASLVLAWLREAIDDLLVAVPVILHLQAPTLKDRHIAVIERSLGHAIFDELDITVAELVALGLKDSRAVIQKIYERSCFERNIESKLTFLAQQMAALELAVGLDRDNKNVMYFTNLLSCTETFQDVFISLDAMARSEFSAPFNLELTDVHAQVKRCLRICTELAALQQKYLQYRVLF